MKLLKAMGVATAATLTLCAQASAQVPLKLEVTPVVGAQLFTMVLPQRFMIADTHYQYGELSTAPIGGAHVGVRVGEWFGIQGNALISPTTLTVTRGTEGLKEIDVRIALFGGSATFTLPKALDNLETFVVTGAGIKRYSYDGEGMEATSSFMVNVGAGFHVALNPRFGIYVEGRDYMSNFDPELYDFDSAPQHDLVFAAGIRYTLTRGGMVVTSR